jgi:methyl-accepting chemotaxis protein
MIAICEECKKKYRIDPEKILGEKTKFKCKACGHMITAHKPVPEPETPMPDATPVASSPRELKPEESSEEKPTQPPKSEKAVKEKKRPELTRPKKLRFGLTAKLFCMMIIVSLVPLAMFWGINLKQTKDRMQVDIKRNTNQVSISIARHVDEWLDKNVKILNTLANMDDMISMDRYKQESLLNIVRKVYPWIYLSFTTDHRGMNIARNDDKPFARYSNSQFYKDIIGGKTVAWQTLIEPLTKKPVLILAVPVKNSEGIVGILANAMSLDDMSGRIVSWESGRSGFAFLVDDTGKVIAHKIGEYVLKQKNLQQHPLIAAFRNGQRGSVSYIDNQGKSILGHVRGTAFGWILAIQQEEKEAFYFIEQLMSYAYLLLSVTVAFVFIIAWFSGRTISRPIIHLTDAADRISVGELDVEIKTKRKDEIGDLAEAISRLQDSIRLSIERLRQRR